MSNEHVEAAFAAWFVRRHGTGATCHHGDLFAEHEKIGFVGGFQEGFAFAQRLMKWYGVESVMMTPSETKDWKRIEELFR